MTIKSDRWIREMAANGMIELLKPVRCDMPETTR